MSETAIVRIPVHYDFASTLCYVAHRVFERIDPQLSQLGVAFEWTPVDLAALLNWKRGSPVPAERRANAARVARELEVVAVAPCTWIDSRSALAIGLRIESEALAASWRERIWTEVFERNAGADLEERCPQLARELGIEVSDATLSAGLAELEARTRAAAAAEVVGAPTLMMGGFPIGGIQSDATMLSMLTRYVQRTRESRSGRERLQ